MFLVNLHTSSQLSDMAIRTKHSGESDHDGKEQYLRTAGGKITCLRCTDQSIRNKLQCGRTATKSSRTQKCQFIFVGSIDAKLFTIFGL